MNSLSFKAVNRVLKNAGIVTAILVASCSYDHFEKTVVGCTNSTLNFTYSVTDASTCGASDGRIEVSSSGGVKPYTLALNAGEYSASSSFTSLIAGSYSISVKDSIGCLVKQTVLVNNKQSTLVLSANTTSSGCSATGTITINASGGVAPYKYQLNGGAYQSSDTFSNLSGGSYSVTAVDAASCTQSISTTVGSTAPSFSATISPVIANNCSTSGCHNGSRRPNLITYSDISGNKSQIVNAINSNMPPSTRLTSQQISEITCWANTGAPNN